MWKSTNKVIRITENDIERLCKFSIEWCKENLGENPKKKKSLSLKITNDRRGYQFCGEYLYRSNTIVIYKDNNDLIEDLISTIIHEYTHYLQPMRKFYHKVAKVTGYDDHPFEFHARQNEKIFFKICWTQVRKKMKLITVDMEIQ